MPKYYTIFFNTILVHIQLNMFKDLTFDVLELQFIDK